VATVEKLEQYMTLLVQPRQLEQLGRRLKTIAADMERVQELQGKESTAAGISTETETKVISEHHPVLPSVFLWSPAIVVWCTKTFL
jgi:hypothetical protein